MARVKINFGYQTDIGKKRKLNEDSLLVLNSSDVADSRIDGVFAVADGMGGHSAGDVASSYIVERLKNAFSENRLTDENKTAEDLENSIFMLMRNTIEDANIRMYQSANSQGLSGGMGTTITASVICEEIAYIAQVGDSRAYLIRNKQIKRLTRDHSWVYEQLEMGIITQEQADIHPKRNILTRAVGIDPDVKVDFYTVELYKGDVIMLCSDGLYGMLKDEEMLNCVRENSNPQNACNKLVKLANTLGGDDNITIAIASITDGKDNSNRSKTVPLNTRAINRQSGKKAISSNQKLKRRTITIITICIIVLLASITYLAITAYQQGGLAWDFWQNPEAESADSETIMNEGAEDLPKIEKSGESQELNNQKNPNSSQNIKGNTN